MKFWQVRQLEPLCHCVPKAWSQHLCLRLPSWTHCSWEGMVQDGWTQLCQAVVIGTQGCSPPPVPLLFTCSSYPTERVGLVHGVQVVAASRAFLAWHKDSVKP